jgi:hypothetical protein
LATMTRSHRKKAVRGSAGLLTKWQWAQLKLTGKVS